SCTHPRDRINATTPVWSKALTTAHLEYRMLAWPVTWLFPTTVLSCTIVAPQKWASEEPPPAVLSVPRTMVMPNHWKPPWTSRLPSTSRIPCPWTPLMLASPRMCTIGKNEAHFPAGFSPSPQFVLTVLSHCPFVTTGPMLLEKFWPFKFHVARAASWL